MKISNTKRELVYSRNNYTCVKCGWSFSGSKYKNYNKSIFPDLFIDSDGKGRHLSIDHIMPKSKGGSHKEENLQTLCNRCNSKKGTKIEVNNG